MAYKFQLGAATLSGALEQQGAIDSVPDGSGVAGYKVGNTFRIDADGYVKPAKLVMPDNTAGKFLVGDGTSYEEVALSGDATLASNGALTIANDAVEQAMIADDAVGAAQLAANAVVNASIASNAAIDMDKLDGGSLAASLSDLAQGDLLYAGDVDAANAIKSITFSNLEDAIFGNVSGDATIAAGGALTIASDAVEQSMIADDAVGADQLAASAVVEASIVDNAVSLAKMAGLAAGKLILGDSNGDPAAVTLSGDATVSNAGVVAIAAEAVHASMMNDDAITGHSAITTGLAGTDELLLSDNGILKKMDLDVLSEFLAGAGLKNDTGVLEVRVSGSIVRASDKIGISGSIAGSGLGYGGGVNSINALSVNVDDSSIEVNSDSLRVKASGVTNAMLAGSIADSKLATISTAGKVALSAIELDGGTDIGAALTATDLIMVDDGANGTMRKSAVSRIGDFLAGDGLGVSSGVLAVSVDDSSIETNSDTLRVKASGITNAMLAGSIADSKLAQITTGDKVAGSAVELAGTTALEDSTGLRLKSAVAGVGLTMASQVLALDLNELTAMGGQLDAAADGLAMLDGTVTKKITVANFAASIAGGGLAVSAGKLTVQANAVNSCGDQNEDLEEGMNFGSATLTADRTWSLPASPTVGDVVHVKAPGQMGINDLTIQRASGGSHTIDGATSITIESPGTAVSFMYASANNWVIF